MVTTGSPASRIISLSNSFKIKYKKKVKGCERLFEVRPVSDGGSLCCCGTFEYGSAEQACTAGSTELCKTTATKVNYLGGKPSFFSRIGKLRDS